MLLPRSIGSLRARGVAAFLAVLAVGVLTRASHQPAGLQNAGFEAGAVGAAPPSWTVAAATDEIRTVATEGPAQFPIYADQGIAVSPYRGAKALRLGRPKKLAESQARGATAVTQSFHSTQSTLVLSTRLFSFEHRGYDRVVVSVTDPTRPDAKFPVADNLTGAAFSVPLPGGKSTSCSATPCSLVISVAKRGQFLDSGWREMRISGLPSDGRALTVRYELLTSNNTAHPSWAYFDDVNRAPVAAISITPPLAQLEGDFVFFDCGASADPDGDPLTCTWRVRGASIDERTVVGPYAIFNFPENDPTLEVALTVSDGASTVATSTASAGAGSLAIQNAAPLVNALNAEVVQDRSVELVCRYLDFGVLDAHTATLKVAGQTLAATSVTENAQAYATGILRATFDATGLAPGDLAGTCAVTDDEGATGSDAFVVRVLASASGRGEPANDSSLAAPQLAADWAHAFSLETPQDVDVFEVRLPNGAPVPGGSEVEIDLSAAADYDLVVLSRTPGQTPFEGQPLKTSPFLSSPFLSSPFLSSPFLSSPFLSSPFLSSPFLSSPFLSSPFLSSPFLSSPFLSSPFLSSPIGFDQVPPSQVAGAPSDGSVTAADVGLDEIGSFDIASLRGESLVVKAISAKLGSEPETALVAVGPGETLYVAVASHEGAFAAAPYQLSLQASRPLDREALLGANCTAAPRVPPAQATAAVEVLHAGPGAPKAIGVIQRQRFQLAHGMSDAELAAWLAQIGPKLDDAGLALRLVSVPSTAFDAADSAPCNVAAQNAAAAAVKSVVQAELAAFPSARSVVIFGDQSVIPHYAELDGTDAANERLYGSDALVRDDSPLAATLAGGFNLTDAFYTAPGLPFGGRTLWFEAAPVGRLAKAPAAIAAELDAFVSSGGTLSAGRALATGYDFFVDGTLATATVLSTLAPTTVMNDDFWTADDLRCEAFGTKPAGSNAVCSVPDLAATNLHGTHWGGLSARGFSTGDFTDFVDTGDLSSGQLAGTLTASIGCHTGLGVPAAWSIPTAFGLGLDPANDWPEQDGVQIRPLNFGLGHTDFADRGTEGLLTELLARAAGGLSLGEALVSAKAGYLLGLRQVDVYDEDSVISFAMLGLPQWRIAAQAAPVAPPAAGASVPYGTLQLTVLESGASATTSHAIEEVTSPRGRYFTLDGHADAPQSRAIQATLRVFEERPASGTRVHDVALRGGTYTELAPFDPVIASFSHEWLQAQDEPKTCVATMSPTQLGTVNSLDVGGQTLQTLLFTGSQFECTLPLADRGVLDVAGNERLWTSATIEALHPSLAAFDSDFVPPRVTRQDVVADPSTGDVTLTLDATDSSGLREIIALVYEDLDGVPGGPGRAVPFTTGDVTGVAGPHTLVLPGALSKLLSIQYVDGAGNLLLKSFKGKLFQAVPVDIRTSVFTNSGSTSIVVAIGDWGALAFPVLTIDFGDGTSAVYELVDANGNPTSIVQLQPDGSALVTVTHDYSGVTASSITVQASVSAAGAGGSDTAVLVRCSDPLGDFSVPGGDIVACSFGAQGTRVRFGLFMAGAVSAEFQYRVDLPQLDGGTMKWNNGNVQAPSGANLVVTPSGTNGLVFDFDAGAFGWNGADPLAISAKTQTGLPGGTQIGFADETQVFVFTP